jgi:hypothetical protein
MPARTRPALIAVLGLAVALSPLGGTAAAAPTAPAPAAAPDATRTVTLPSGDRLDVRTDPTGRLLVSPVRAGTPVAVREIGGDVYALPLAAERQPGFDPARYDVSALLRGDTTAPPPAVQPAYPMRTLTVNAVDERGNPIPSAILNVFNNDDSRKYDRAIALFNGLAKVSVPDGHYSAEIDVPAYDTAGNLTAVRAVFTDFTVDGAPTAVGLDARTATNTASVSTPRPANLVGQDYFWFRGPDEQTGTPFDWNLPPGVPFYFSDNDPGGVGVQHFYVHDRFDSPAGTARPYTYDVEFTTDGVLAGSQHHRVRDADLAVLDTRYRSATARTGSILPFDFLPWEEIQYRQYYPVAEPRARTEYVTGNLGLIYQSYLEPSGHGDPATELWASGYHAYKAGQHATVDWRRGPLVPGLPSDSGDGTGSDNVSHYHCPACREGDTLSLSLAPLTDGEPDHGGAPAPGTATSRLHLFQGDTQLADLADTGTDVTVGPDPAGYRLVYDQSGGGPTTHTEWTFRSQHSGAATVPSYWTCGASGKTNLTDCSALSLLTLGYRLDERLDGSIGTGPQAMTLTVGHTSGAPAVPVGTPTVAVSYDHGATWTSVPAVPCGNGAFRVRWTGAAGTLSLRVTASDSAGATVTQTALDAVPATP